jgi:hypothetical protein
MSIDQPAGPVENQYCATSRGTDAKHEKISKNLDQASSNGAYVIAIEANVANRRIWIKGQ